VDNSVAAMTPRRRIHYKESVDAKGPNKFFFVPASKDIRERKIAVEFPLLQLVRAEQVFDCQAQEQNNDSHARRPKTD
jgi:hypothetical protein